MKAMIKEKWLSLWHSHNVLCSWLVVAVALYLAYVVCSIILHYSWIDNDAPVVFALAVVVISRVTYKMHYGIIASLISSIAVNYFFTYPYEYFTLEIAGYPIDFVCFTGVSLVASLLTYELRGEKEKADRHRQETITLYEKNKKLEKERLAAELETEKEKMHSDLLRAVSHDLRTPLTAMAGASSVLMKNGENLSEAEKHKLASDIYGEALWLTQMVENLLSVTRFKSDEEVQIKKSSELVEEILEESITKVKRRFAQQKILVKAPEELLFVPMDAMLIEQVLMNLIENAIRHSGVTAPIEVSVREEGEQAVFSVRDHGRGIPEEKMKDLFSGMGHHNDTGRGMGIGLSVCKTIVLAHGGELCAENQADGGVEFRFSLPMEKESKGEDLDGNETIGDGGGG